MSLKINPGSGTITNASGGGITIDPGASQTVDVINGGTIVVADGTAASPSITFNADTNCGLYSPVDDSVSVAGQGLEILRFTGVASSVNYLELKSSATGNPLLATAAGTDANIGITLTPKGTGNVTLGTMVFDSDQTIGAGQDNYVLTYDNGTGLISLEAAAGGASNNWLTANNGTDFTTAPTGTGSNSISMGDAAATSTATNAIAIGTNAQCKSADSIVIGSASDTTYGVNSGNFRNIVIGYQGEIFANMDDSICIGTNTWVKFNTDSNGGIAIGDTARTSDNSIAIGDNANSDGGANRIAIGDGATSSGVSSIAIGTSATASSTLSVVIGHNASSTSYGNVVIGYDCDKTGGGDGVAIGRAITSNGGNGSISIGYSSNGNADFSTAIGGNASAGAINSCALGRFATANGGDDGSYAIGAFASTDYKEEHVYSSGYFSAQGDAKTSHYYLRTQTTDATQTVLKSYYHNSTTGTNKPGIPSDGTIFFRANIVARRTDVDGESAGYVVEGVCDNNAGTSALVGTVTKTVVAEDTAAWDVDVTVNDTDDTIEVKVTGEASKTIRWFCDLQCYTVKG